MIESNILQVDSNDLVNISVNNLTVGVKNSVTGRNDVEATGNDKG
ncbi:unnamed protein product [Debaryomyces fabryi]|nr:unnamed protein product [Debaryomyces fabryi]